MNAEFVLAYQRRRKTYRSDIPRLDDFEQDRPDADERLVPFSNRPEFARLPAKQKLDLLTGANLAFLEATQRLEVGLLNDAMRGIMKLGGAQPLSMLLQHLASEEGEHATDASLQIDVTRALRRYEGHIPTAHFIQVYEERQARLTGLRRWLCAIAFAALLEIDQTQLHLLATSTSASRWQRAFHERHWVDEQQHSEWFQRFIGGFYSQLRAEDRQALLEELSVGARAIGAFDYAAWRAMLANAGLMSVAVEELLATQAAATSQPPAGLVTIAGIVDLPAASFGY